MLAVAQYQLQTKEDIKNKYNIKYVHGCGEKTGLEKNDVNLVSMCLVNHELPAGILLSTTLTATHIYYPLMLDSLLSSLIVQIFHGKYSKKLIAFYRQVRPSLRDSYSIISIPLTHPYCTLSIPSHNTPYCYYINNLNTPYCILSITCHNTFYCTLSIQSHNTPYCTNNYQVEP